MSYGYEHIDWKKEETKMVDATEATESKYLNPDLVRGSKTKKAIILDAGSYEETDYGDRLTLRVEIDGKEKSWRPNRDSAKNLTNVWGAETKAWLGKTVRLNVMSVMGKDCVIATADDAVVQAV